jgi:uncharacterized protein (UPF0333 family)
MRVGLRKKSKGQSTIEYILVITAIVALILWAAYTFFTSTPSNQGVIERSLSEADNAIDRAADRFLDY